MNRRDFLIGLCGVATPTVLPTLASGQSAIGKPVRVGVLADEPWSGFAGLREGMSDLGYIERGDLQYEYRWAHGQVDRFPAFAAELVHLPVDVIVTWGTVSTLAAREATRSLPIVMAGVDDPIASGIVTDLAHPGGNITGFSSSGAMLEEKRLELLKELLPGLSRVRVLSNPTNPACALAVQRIRPTAAARTLALDVIEMDNEASLDRGLAETGQSHPEGVLVLTDLFLLGQRQKITAAMTQTRVPAVYNSAEYVEVGGLVSYAAEPRDLLQSVAVYIDKILNGDAPGKLPIQQAKHFELLVNTRAAKQIGLTIPASILDRADEVIN